MHSVKFFKTAGPRKHMLQCDNVCFVSFFQSREKNAMVIEKERVREGNIFVH